VATGRDVDEAGERAGVEVTRGLEFNDYRSRLDVSFPDACTIDFMPAGQQVPTYSTTVSNFDWTMYWDTLRGQEWLAALANDARRAYDFVLIDSRTGLSDGAGICTVELPDAVACCFTMVRHGVDGTAAAASIRALREQRGVPVELFPVPMRIDPDDLGLLGANPENYARRRLDAFVAECAQEDLGAYWSAVEVPSSRAHFYGETLVAFSSLATEGWVLRGVYERLAGLLAGRHCALSPPDPVTAARYRTELDKIIIRPESTSVRRRAFISYVREDAADIDQVADALRLAGVDVWLDRTHLKPGDRWIDVIRGAISTGDYFIAFFSRAYANRPVTFMNEELLLAIDQLRQRPRHRRWFIPVVLDDCEIPKIPIGPTETLEHLHHIRFTPDWQTALAALLSAMA
jgi:TIR domain